MGKTYRSGSNVRVRVTLSRKDRINHKKADQTLKQMRRGRIDHNAFDDEDMEILENDDYGYWTMEND